MKAFVYCWTDKKTNKLYVGSHKGSIDDGYICSSKYMMEQYNQRPEDFSRQIVAQGTHADMRKLEETFLKNCNAAKDKMFYNMHNGDGMFFLKSHTQETKNKIAEKQKGRIRKDLSERNKKGPTTEQLRKQIETKRKKGCYLSENNPMFGKKHSEEVKEAHSLRMSGSNNPNYNKKFSEETKKKMSDVRKAYWSKRKEGIVNGD